MKKRSLFLSTMAIIVALVFSGCGYNLKQTLLPTQDKGYMFQNLGDSPDKPANSLAGKIHVTPSGRHQRQIVAYNGGNELMVTPAMTAYVLSIPEDRSQKKDYGYKFFDQSFVTAAAPTKVATAVTAVTAATGKMFIKNPGAPLVKWFPGDSTIRCIAAKIYRDYRKADPNECRLELCVYGGKQAEVEDPVWFDNWLNGSQRIVNPAILAAYFDAIDPNTCVWDENGNGGYRRWCAGDTTVSFRGWAKSSGITEERLPDGRIEMTVSEGALLFKTGSWDIQPEHDATLVSVYNRLLGTTGPIVVEGHTDNAPYRSGSGMNNALLSQKRAAAVATVLAGLGINRSRITEKGYGSANPVAGTEMFQTAAERKKNRRVVIIFDPPTEE